MIGITVDQYFIDHIIYHYIIFLLSLFLVIDQLIAVKIMFSEHIISYFKYYLYGIWIVVILEAISFASVISNHYITFSLLVM